MPNVLSPRDLVSRPDNMDETVLHTDIIFCVSTICLCPNKGSSSFNELAIAITYPKMSFIMGLALIKGVIFRCSDISATDISATDVSARTFRPRTFRPWTFRPMDISATDISAMEKIQTFCFCRWNSTVYYPSKIICSIITS